MSESQGTGTASHDAGVVAQGTDTSTVSTVQAPAAETQSAGEQKTQAPAEVDYTFEAPEGVELDAASVDSFKAIAKELGLTKEGAQKVVELAVKREQDRAEAFEATKTKWLSDVTADKELGAPENQALARKAIDTFGTPELRTLLDASGLGNHPEVVRLALKVGRAISEDKVIVGRTGTAPAKDAAAVLYPNQA